MDLFIPLFVAALAGQAIGNQLMTISSSLQTLILNDHNRVRREVSPPAAKMERISWNNDLKATAEVHARRLASSCGGLVHDKKKDRTPKSYVNMNQYKAGQNLAYKGWGVGIGSSYNVASKVEAAVKVGMKGWEDEKKCWKWGSNSHSCVVGHYTQQVWDQTNEVGCAVSYCKKKEGGYDWHRYYTVCNYFPGGNWCRSTNGDALTSCASEYAVPYVKKSGGSTSLINPPCKGWNSYDVYDANSCKRAGNPLSCGSPKPGNIVCGCARRCLCKGGVSSNIQSAGC